MIESAECALARDRDVKCRLVAASKISRLVLLSSALQKSVTSRRPLMRCASSC
jgi:hypothetical protein